MNENEKKLLSSLKKFVLEEKKEKVKIIYKSFHPSEIFYFTKNWNQHTIILLFNLLDPEDASSFFINFNSEQKIELIEKFPPNIISNIFNEMQTDEAVDALEELPYKIIQNVLNATSSDVRKKINKIFTFAKNQCGFHMNVDFIYIFNKNTVLQAKKIIKTQIKNDQEIVGNIFVLDDNRKLLGYVKPDDIFVSEDNVKISLILRKIEAAKVTDNILRAEEIMEKFDVSTTPVVDSNNVINGVIESDDIIEKYELIEEVFLEASALKQTKKSYLDSSVIEIFKSRIFWIIILLFAGIFSQIVIMSFQKIWTHNGIWVGGGIDQAINGAFYSSILTLALTSSISISSSIQDTSGNTGSQVSSTFIREISIGSINEENYKSAIFKEFKVANLIAVTASICSFARTLLVWLIMGEFSNIKENAAQLDITLGKTIGWYLLIAFISSFAFFFSIILGNMLGVFFPIISNKINADGAIISGPVQTTIIDIFVSIIYLSLTTFIFLPIKDYFWVDETTFQTIFLILQI